MKHELNVIRNNAYQCDGCTVCCNVMGVEELGKPYYTNCEHKNRKGCNIYGNHPKSCNEFFCMWRMGMLGPRMKSDTDRPDKLGFMFSPAVNQGKAYIDVYETREMNPVPTSKELQDLTECINTILQLAPSITGVRYYYFKTKVGVPWPLNKKYPQGTHNIGNPFIPDKDNPNFYWHVDPDKLPASTDRNCADCHGVMDHLPEGGWECKACKISYNEHKHDGCCNH